MLEVIRTIVVIVCFALIFLAGYLLEDDSVEIILILFGIALIGIIIAIGTPFCDIIKLAILIGSVIGMSISGRTESPFMFGIFATAAFITIAVICLI